MNEMHQATKQTERTIALLSEAYLHSSEFGGDFTAAYALPITSRPTANPPGGN